MISCFMKNINLFYQHFRENSLFQVCQNYDRIESSVETG